MENGRKSNAAAWLIVCTVGAVIWLLLIVLKSFGAVRFMDWLPLTLGIFWIPIALMLLLNLAARLLLLCVRARYWYREWKRRRKIARTLRDTMHGLTLNNVGPVYGVQRKAGEPNRDYERRILKAARTVDTVNLNGAQSDTSIKPATGSKLDAIAKKYGLTRKRGETDTELQERVRRKMYEKLEGVKN